MYQRVVVPSLIISKPVFAVPVEKNPARVGHVSRLGDIPIVLRPVLVGLINILDHVVREVLDIDRRLELSIILVERRVVGIEPGEQVVPGHRIAFRVT